MTEINKRVVEANLSEKDTGLPGDDYEEVDGRVDQVDEFAENQHLK